MGTGFRGEGGRVEGSGLVSGGSWVKLDGGTVEVGADSEADFWVGPSGVAEAVGAALGALAGGFSGLFGAWGATGRSRSRGALGVSTSEGVGFGLSGSVEALGKTGWGVGGAV
jgi:hypothetical protein